MKRDLVSEYQNLKKELDANVREQAKLQGVLEQILKKLEEDHECSSLAQIIKYLEKKRRELKGLEEQLTKDVVDYETKWSPLLEESRS